MKQQNENTLFISEFIAHTIQGEGVWAGCPATFLRLTRCHLNCSFCDTKELNEIETRLTNDKIFQLMESQGVIEALKEGQHLVITGGAPLLQQGDIDILIKEFVYKYNFKPFIEVENECTIIPTLSLISEISCWDNSPKLGSSGVSTSIRYRRDVIKFMSQLSNSWFKFVVADEGEWKEIQVFYLDTGLIKKEQVILMPMASSRQELLEKQEMVADLAIKNKVRYSGREHIAIWNRKRGV